MLTLRPKAMVIDVTDALRILKAVARQQPHVQCLTNTVAQSVTANMLLAIGARVSMAVHPDEIVGMMLNADANVINLGTIDYGREAAITRILANGERLATPLVLDPVFVDRSPLRLRITQSLLAQNLLEHAGSRFANVILRGNALEMRSLDVRSNALTRVTTGDVDTVDNAVAGYQVRLGHGLMSRVTGIGCASSAIIAAFAAVEAEPARAAAAALTCFGLAGEMAARRAKGPGSFAVELIDSLYELAESKAEAV